MVFRCELPRHQTCHSRCHPRGTAVWGNDHGARGAHIINSDMGRCSSLAHSTTRIRSWVHTVPWQSSAKGQGWSSTSRVPQTCVIPQGRGTTPCLVCHWFLGGTAPRAGSTTPRREPRVLPAHEGRAPEEESGRTDHLARTLSLTTCSSRSSTRSRPTANDHEVIHFGWGGGWSIPL